MAGLNINAETIAPIDLRASLLNYWANNQFYPMFSWKAYKVLFTIIRKPWQYFMKVEHAIFEKDWKTPIKIKTFWESSNLAWIVEILNTWKDKIEDKEHLIIKSGKENNNNENIHGSEIVELTLWLWNLTAESFSINDANETALKTLDFYKYEEALNVLWALTNYDKKDFINRVENFLPQYEEIKKKIITPWNKTKALRMLIDYTKLIKDNDFQKWNDKEFSKNQLFNEVLPISIDLIKGLRKIKAFNKEDNLYFLRKTKSLLDEAILNKAKIPFDDVEFLEEKLNSTEMEVLKQKEKMETWVVAISREYIKRRKEKWYSTSEYPSRHNVGYEDDELTDILESIESTFNQPWVQRYSTMSKDYKDVFVDLAITYNRRNTAIQEIFNLAFSPKPFRWAIANHDLWYTVKILDFRNKLFWEKYWMPNEYFIWRFEEDPVLRKVRKNIPVNREK